MAPRLAHLAFGGRPAGVPVAGGLIAGLGLSDGEAEATWAEIARETGHDWRTVKRYLSSDAPTMPPAPAKRGPGPRKTDPYAHLIDAWLRAQPKLKASVIWERLVTEHGFDGHYQLVKVYVRENRARLTNTDANRGGS